MNRHKSQPEWIRGQTTAVLEIMKRNLWGDLHAAIAQELHRREQESRKAA